MHGADYYISDLHLAPDTPGTNALFYAFHEAELRDARSLTIIGDFLEAYSGFKQLRIPFTAVLMETLRELTGGGVTVRFIAGNRDFLLAKDCTKFGIQGFPHDTIIDGNSETIAAIHGDSFCLDDHAYLRFRWIIRTIPFHWLNYVTTPKMGQAVTQRMRAKSKARHARRVAAGTPTTSYDIKDEAVLAYLKRNPVDTLICGHIHQPQERMYGESGPRMLVLGDWNEHSAIIAAAMPGERVRLMEFTNDGLKHWPHDVKPCAGTGGPDGQET
jgi:UDP-2,3-diacylglucosamine hydrolase